MPGIAVDSIDPFFSWVEDADCRQYVVATIGDLPANTVVAAGTAGIIEYRNGGARFRMDDALLAAPKVVFPAVSGGGGKKGDEIRVQVYGPANATFINQLDTTNKKHLKTGAGAVTAEAAADDNVLWAVVRGDGADSKTQQVFLAGVAMRA